MECLTTKDGVIGMKPKLFLTSDEHFGHENIIGYCREQFADLTDMHLALIERWNAVVKPYDTVIVVGDFCMGQRDKTLAFSQRLMGNKILVPGNHDYCWKGGYAGERLAHWREVYANAGFVILDELWISGPKYGQEVQICHFPFRAEVIERHTGRYDTWSPDDKGQWLFHGHTHTPEQQSGPKSIHVGVDGWDFTPVERDELFAIMEASDA